MESAFYSYVDDTIEDAFDASSDTELADNDTSVAQPSHTRLNCEPKDTNNDSRASFDVMDHHTATDWFSDGQRELLPKDNLSQGNSNSQRLPTTGNLWLNQPSADSKCSLTASKNIPPNAGLSPKDMYHSELSQPRTSHCRGNVYVRKSDADSSRRSLLKSKTCANSHFSMSEATLSGSTSRVASAMYLPDDDDKVMEIVEEQLENDDDDDDDDNADTDVDDDEDEDGCIVAVKPISAADDDDDDVDTDVDESEVDEVEEISEDDEEPEDRLADEEIAVLQEAERAAAEAAASAASGPSTDQTATASVPVADASTKETFPQSSSDVPRELPLSAQTLY